VEIASHIFRLEGERYPELVVRPVEGAAGRQHAYNGVSFSIQADRPADQFRIRAKLR
jgi:hypothetical protein